MAAILQTASGAERQESIGILGAPTPGATVAIDLTTGAKSFKWTVGEAETVNISGSQLAGQELTLILVQDSGSGRVITFGTGFKSAGTITLTTSETSVVSFRSDGTNFYETGRIAGIT